MAGETGRFEIQNTHSGVLAIGKVVRSVLEGLVDLRVDSPMNYLAYNRPMLGLVSLHPSS